MPLAGNASGWLKQPQACRCSSGARAAVQGRAVALSCKLGQQQAVRSMIFTVSCACVWSFLLLELAKRHNPLRYLCEQMCLRLRCTADLRVLSR